MTRTWIWRAAVLAACIAFPCHWALTSHAKNPHTLADVDFAQGYYDARCVLEHKDAYDGISPLREAEADGWSFEAKPPADPAAARTVIALADYPPTTIFVTAPFALLPYATADAIWFWLMAGLLVVASLLMWDLAETAPIMAGCMMGFLLLNSVMVILLGNPAGVIAPFCAIAAWCLVKRRFEWVAVVLVAVSLVMKPQTAGFVWLYFLLAGGTMRKRGWQMLAGVAVLSACAALWIAPSSPRWVPEMRTNIEKLAARGDLSDPGVSGATYRSFDPICSLQNAASVFDNNPHFYNPLSYAIGGAMILVWGIAVLRRRATREGALLALAVVPFLTLLPVYHRTHDAKLLLLTIPACAMLWAGGGARRWWALGLTWAAIVVTSDMPNIALVVVQRMFPTSPESLGGKLLLLVQHPAPLVLLAAGCFYLWAFWRYEETEVGVMVREETAAGG